MMKIAIVAAALALAGCTNTRIQTAGTSAPHNADATRTWWVVRDTNGNDSIVLCDTYLLQTRGQLCMRAVP